VTVCDDEESDWTSRIVPNTGPDDSSQHPQHLVIRNVRNRLFYFCSVSVRCLKKILGFGRNEFGSVRFKKRGSVRIL